MSIDEFAEHLRASVRLSASKFYEPDAQWSPGCVFPDDDGLSCFSLAGVPRSAWPDLVAGAVAGQPVTGAFWTVWVKCDDEGLLISPNRPTGPTSFYSWWWPTPSWRRGGLPRSGGRTLRPPRSVRGNGSARRRA